MRIMLSGAAGFVGSHVLRHLLQETDYEIACPVTFRHKGVPARIELAMAGIPGAAERTHVVLCDLRSRLDSVTVSRLGHCEAVLNVASQSHVDRSIERPAPFIEDNVQLMTTVLEYAAAVDAGIVLQMSTDEVYGPAPGGYAFREGDPLLPSNPYAASKAAQEMISISYWRTYGVPVVITNTVNLLGESQDPEKFVPKTLRALLRGDRPTVHVSPKGRPGSRFYLHARNLADAWLHLLRTHSPAVYPQADRPDRFHITGEREVSNMEMVRRIASAAGLPLPKVELVNFHSARPGHDSRYGLDGSKLAATGWKPPVPLDESIERTVRWSLEHPEWMA